MKKLIFIISVFVFCIFTHQGFSQCEQAIDSGYYEGRLTKYYKQEIQGRLFIDSLYNNDYMSRVESFLTSINATLKKIWYEEPVVGAIEIILPDTSDALNMVNIFISSQLFNSVSLTGPLYPQSNPGAPNDQYYNEQWYLDNTNGIKAPRAWWIAKGNGSKVRIYILDSGIKLNSSGQLTHEDLMGTNIILGTNFYNGRNVSVRDSGGHGTEMAGLIIATRNNGLGMVGVDSSVEVVIHKVYYGLITSPGANPDSLARAINNAVTWKNQNPNKGCIINLSLGGGVTSPALEQAISSAQTFGVVVVCASGNGSNNTGTSPVDYPGRYSTQYNNVICVGASQKDGNRSSYSNYSPNSSTQQLTLLAPGGKGYGWPDIENIFTTTVSSSGNYRREAWGTSNSTALVSGTVGLMLSVKSTFTPIQIRNLLIRGTGNTTYNQYTGWGRLNV